MENLDFLVLERLGIDNGSSIGSWDMENAKFKSLKSIHFFLFPFFFLVFLKKYMRNFILFSFLSVNDHISVII